MSRKVSYKISQIRNSKISISICHHRSPASHSISRNVSISSKSRTNKRKSDDNSSNSSTFYSSFPSSKRSNHLGETPSTSSFGNKSRAKLSQSDISKSASLSRFGVKSSDNSSTGAIERIKHSTPVREVKNIQKRKTKTCRNLITKKPTPKSPKPSKTKSYETLKGLTSSETSSDSWIDSSVSSSDESFSLSTGHKAEASLSNRETRKTALLDVGTQTVLNNETKLQPDTTIDKNVNSGNKIGFKNQTARGGLDLTKPASVLFFAMFLSIVNNTRNLVSF